MAAAEKWNPVNLPHARPRRGKLNQILNPVGPIDREIVARWIDARREALEAGLQSVIDARARGIEQPGDYNQSVYFRCGIAHLKALAWDLRTGKGGPLADYRKRKAALQQEQQQNPE